jgi:triacylglycerol lipase
MTDFKFNHLATTYDPQNALSLGLAAQKAYEGADTASQASAVKAASEAWGFNRFRAFSKFGTQAFVMANDQIIITAFRGTEPKVIKDWLTDARARLAAGPNNLGQVHTGFSTALSAVYDQIKNTIINEFQDNGQSLWFTGHSLGAALATLAARKFQLETNRFPQGIYTFGQPRTGDLNFAKSFDGQLQSVTFRFVNNNDLVPHLPPDKLLNNKLVRDFTPPALRDFKHIGLLRYFDADGNLKDNPSVWDSIKEGVRDAISDLGGLAKDAVNDHKMENYITSLKKNL